MFCTIKPLQGESFADPRAGLRGLARLPPSQRALSDLLVDCDPDSGAVHLDDRSPEAVLNSHTDMYAGIYLALLARGFLKSYPHEHKT